MSAERDSRTKRIAIGTTNVSEFCNPYRRSVASMRMLCVVSAQHELERCTRPPSRDVNSERKAASYYASTLLLRCEKMKAKFWLSLSLLLICGVASAQTRKWHVPTYKCLVFGKSNKDEVKRTFGEPAWYGNPEDEYDNPDKNFISYEYENVGGFEGRTVVIMKTRSGVVTDISLHPPYQKPLPLKQALEVYGSEYVERESALGPCPTAKVIRSFKRPERREHPFFLVYPKKGMYIAVDENNNAREIVYMRRCP